MAVRIVVNRNFRPHLTRAIDAGLLAAGQTYHRYCVLATNKSNQRGRQPSLPGESPKKRTGFGQRGIGWQYDKWRQKVRVGVSKNAIYLFYLEVGTKPRVIRAKGKLLRIPWMGKGSPSKAEQKRLGLRKLQPDGYGNRWFYFRKSIRHPGIKPRPWLVKTFKLRRLAIGRAFVIAARRAAA